jgi:DNA-binding GntR family transcriptional regulator
MREALRALEAERLVELIPNRGPFVAKLGEKEVQGIHDVWALLTGEMVAQFTSLATAPDIARLDACLKRLRAALKEKNTISQLAATNAFFNCISTRCGNPVLFDIVVRLVARINFLRTQSLQLEGWPSICADEMAEVAAAIRQKKPAAARAAVQRHISSACAAAKQVIVFRKSESSSGARVAGRRS